MISYGGVEQVFFNESGSILNPPFTTSIVNGLIVSTVDLRLGNDRVGVWLSALVNWSVTFAPPSGAATLTTAGFVDVVFELLLDGVAIQRISQTAVQKGNVLSATSTTTQVANLLHFDQSLLSDGACNNTYSLRVASVALTAPVYNNGSGTVSAAVGAVSLVAATVEAGRT